MVNHHMASHSKVRSVARGRLAGALLVAFGLLAASCGGGGPTNHHVQSPLVRGFSPFMSPIDFNTNQQSPTFTDGNLTVSTDSRYPGKIVIFFQSETTLDPKSIFVGGDPGLGLDLSALQVLQYIPGSGNVELPLSQVEVQSDRIVCTPAVLPLADGQYEISVLDNVKNVEGKGLQDGPVHMSFTVGANDSISPEVVTTQPIDNAVGVGAGAPPPQPLGATNVADVRTNIFGPTSPDVLITFNEAIDASRVTVGNITFIDAGFPPAAGAPPLIPPAANFPELKSTYDGATLPSNGHEVIWRPDTYANPGFPFGTIVEGTVVGAYNTQAAADADPDLQSPDNAAPIADLSGNPLLVSFKFSFQTIAPPDLPQNPFPEYAVWWATSNAVGALDTINQVGLADQFTGAVVFPTGVPKNVLPKYTNTVANSTTIPGFEPLELSIDNRTNGATCNTFVYAMSSNSGQLVIIDSRWSLPVAIVNTPRPGGISNQTGFGQAANIVVVTNTSANTLTFYDVGYLTTGISYLNGPIFVQHVQQTGNTPRAVSMSLSPTGSWNRDPGYPGPPQPILMYNDYTDGVVNTTRMNLDGPVKQFNLGPNSAPNDVVMSPCLTGNNPPLFLAAISQGGLPGEGKVAYYISGPSCDTGASQGIAADSIVGDLTGFDGPAGLDEILPMGNGAWFALAESGAAADRVRTLGLEVGAFNTPRIINTFGNVGANPVSIAHPAAWVGPCIDFVGAPWLCSTNPKCWFNGTEQQLQAQDGSLATAQKLYICARGSGLITAVNMITGARDFYSPISIPGVRFLATCSTQ